MNAVISRGEEEYVETATQNLRIAVGMRLDERLGAPVISLTMQYQDKEVPGKGVGRRTTFDLSAEQAQELGVILVGASATATVFNDTNRYLDKLQGDGKENEAAVVMQFMEWMGGPDAGDEAGLG